MKKPVSVFILALISLIIIVLVVVAPYLRLGHLEKSLYDAKNAEEAATVARAIMKANSSRGMHVIQEYANQQDLCALDAAHGILLIGDEATGKIHEVYAGPQGTIVASGDSSLDKAVRAAIPETTLESFSIGEPPVLIEGVHVLSSEATQVDFLLKTKTDNEWYRFSCKFAGDRLTEQRFYDVSNKELQTWQEKQDWPLTGK